MSNLVEHAKRELALLGEEQETVDGLIKVIQAFADMGHSGGSASVAIPMINDLLQFKNLRPLTDDPNEWQSVYMGEESCWQSNRNAEAFSHDHGKTYYLLSEGGNNRNRHPEYIIKQAEKSLPHYIPTVLRLAKDIVALVPSDGSWETEQ